MGAHFLQGTLNAGPSAFVSPSTYPCRLCALTYGLTGAHREWTQFIRGLPLPAEFLHRDEFRAADAVKSCRCPWEPLVRCFAKS